MLCSTLHWTYDQEPLPTVSENIGIENDDGPPAEQGDQLAIPDQTLSCEPEDITLPSSQQQVPISLAQLQISLDGKDDSATVPATYADEETARLVEELELATQTKPSLSWEDEVRQSHRAVPQLGIVDYCWCEG